MIDDSYTVDKINAHIRFAKIDFYIKEYLRTSKLDDCTTELDDCTTDICKNFELTKKLYPDIKKQ